MRDGQGSIFLQKIDNSAQMHIQKDIILPRIFIISKNPLWFQLSIIHLIIMMQLTKKMMVPLYCAEGCERGSLNCSESIQM